MCAKLVQKAVMAACFAAIAAVFSFAQAVLTVASAPAIAADIGYAEPAGPIAMTVVSGVSVASPVIITYSAPITNNNASEISISGTGGLAGSGLVFDPETNSVIVNLRAGGSTGDSIHISGVRVAIAGLNLSRVTASLFCPEPSGNLITSGETNPVVIAEIRDPFSVDQSGTDPLSYSNGAATRSSASFKIRENYAAAFAGSVAGEGRIRIVPFPSLPEGIHITLAATALSDTTNAVFTTLSGAPETIPREDGSMDVVYRFTSAPDSALTQESFDFSATMTVDTTASGIIRFQAELIPIGLAVPTQEYPSTALPRYAERLVPDEADLVSGSTELAFPFQIDSDNVYTGIALTNPQNYRVRVTLTAYDSEGSLVQGSGITNPVTIVLPRKGQFAALDTEIFGHNFNKTSAGMIRVAGQTSQLEGMYLTGDIAGPKLDGGMGDISDSRSWYLPSVFRDGKSPFNMLGFFNPGNADTELNLRLLDVNGKQVAAGSKTIPAGGSSSVDAAEIFGVDLNSFVGGYIKGDSDKSVIVRNTFGNEFESNVLPAQAGLALASFYIPHFASGAQYSTEINIINANSVYITSVTLTPLDNNGAQMADPIKVQISPGWQFTRTVAELFPDLGKNLATGSIKVEQAGIQRGPFPYVPPITGSVRFSNVDGSASATLPLIMAPSNDFVYPHVAQTQDWFTGVAIVNTQSAPAGFILEVYDKNSVRVGTYSDELQPGAKLAKLVREMVPASAGQSGGYIRVTSNSYLTSFALFGTNDLRSLSAIPLQSVK